MIRKIPIIFILLFILSDICNGLKVTTKLGNIIGFKEKIYENEINVFLGIPFAVPPVGKLRFRKPQPIIESFSKSVDATKWPNICMQDTLHHKYYSGISEDCLYLNVWTPANIDFSVNLKPVMIFIHGGGFLLMGSSYKHYNGSVLSSFGDVVVVTMNYRLGAFGFLSTGKPDAPGNVGLYDQALALEWVHKNIKYFGGDINKITLFGESAGALSTILHLYSPLSQRINRAIIMSGSIYENLYIDKEEDAIKKTLEFAKLMGCRVEYGVSHVSDDIIDCLRKVEAKKFVEFQEPPEVVKYANILSRSCFMPIYGEAFIPKEMKKMLQESLLDKNVPLMVGNVADEGQITLYLEDLGFASKNGNFQERLEFFIHSNIITKMADFDEILKFYFDQIDDKNSDEAKMAYYTALGDLFFNCETVYFINEASKTNDLYQYFYDYALVNDKDNVEPCDLEKVCHANELPITFGTVSHPKDIEVSKRWMKIITDFAKSGTVKWPKHTMNSKPYFIFTGVEGNNKVSFDFKSDACKLWKKVHLYNNMLKEEHVRLINPPL